jgi:hypothetical protein
MMPGYIHWEVDQVYHASTAVAVPHGMMPYSRPALLPHFGKPYYYFRIQVDWSTAFPTISLDRIHDSYG